MFLIMQCLTESVNIFSKILVRPFSTCVLTKFSNTLLSWKYVSVKIISDPFFTDRKSMETLMYQIPEL